MTTSDLPPAQKRQTRLRNTFWYGGFWLLFTLWLRLALPESLMGWERHQLFRFSADYLTFFSSQPYPILLYLQAFFTQFYLYPLLGAAIISGLLILGMGAWQRLTGRYWTGVVWAALMLPLIPYFNLLWILVWLVLLGGGLLINLRRLSKGWRWSVTMTCSLLGSLLIQENIAMALIFWSAVGGVQTRSWRDGLYGLTAGLVGAGLGIGLIFWFGYPLYHILFLSKWTLLNAKLEFIATFPALFFNCPLLIRFYLYVCLVISICLPLTLLLPKPNRTDSLNFRTYTCRKSLLKKGLSGLMLFGLIGSTFYVNLRYQMEDFYLIDRLCINRHWHQASKVAEHAFYERARPEVIGNRHRFFFEQKPFVHTMAHRLDIKPIRSQNFLEEALLAETLKICLLAEKQTSSTLFTYNGTLYFPFLFHEESQYSPSTFFMAIYYTQIGFYAEALHTLYDLVTGHRISTAVLEPLLWNSVVVGDYEPCRKFIRFFEQSLFHKDIAHRYTAYLADTARTMQQPDIAAARTKLATHNYTVLTYQPDDNMYFRMQHEADNAAVYEYALTLWMVYKNHERILAELPRIRQYYQVLPTHVQEAVLTNFSAEHIGEAPIDIDPTIRIRYTDFLQTYTLYLNGYTSFQKLKKRFEDTYWYHLYFNDFKTINTQPNGRSGEI